MCGGALTQHRRDGLEIVSTQVKIPQISQVGETLRERADTIGSDRQSLKIGQLTDVFTAIKLLKKKGIGV